jgi:hypothetical protein
MSTEENFVHLDESNAGGQHNDLVEKTDIMENCHDSKSSGQENIKLTKNTDNKADDSEPIYIITELNQKSVMELTNNVPKLVKSNALINQKWQFVPHNTANAYTLENMDLSAQTKVLTETNGKDLLMKEKRDLYKSIFQKYGKTEFVSVYEYGAVFLN